MKKLADAHTVEERLAQALRALKALEAAGAEAYVVGGAVRDALLGRPIHDIDIASSLSWEDAARALEQAGARVIKTGIAQGTITALFSKPKQSFEVTTFRTEDNYADGRHPKNVTVAKTLTEDVKRRDFTINALAWSPSRGVIDEVGGLADLEVGVIRCVGDAHKRFQEDHLRILRALRLRAELGFSIEPTTERALHEQASNLQLLSQERIGLELTCLIMAPYAAEVLESYPDVMVEVIPCLKPAVGFSLSDADNNRTLYEHTAQTLKYTYILAGGVVSPALMWAALLHELAKPQTKEPSYTNYPLFAGAPEQSAEIAKHVLKAFGVPKHLREEVAVIIALQDVAIMFDADVERRFLQTAFHLQPVLLRSTLYATFVLMRASEYAKDPANNQCYLSIDEFEKRVRHCLLSFEYERLSNVSFQLVSELVSDEMDGEIVALICHAMRDAQLSHGFVYRPQDYRDFCEFWCEQADELVDFFTPRTTDNKQIGLELERFMLDENNQPITFETTPGITQVFEQFIAQDGAMPIDDDLLVGIESEVELEDGEVVNFTLTLEPGSQLEVSLAPVDEAYLCYDALIHIDANIQAYAKNAGFTLQLVAKGMHPYVTEPRDIKLLPKSRYEAMNDYFSRLGGLGKHMMRLSASTQVSIDIDPNPNTVASDLKLALALEPYLYLATKNTPQESLSRQTVWEQTDQKRCSFPASFYDNPNPFTYLKWLLHQQVFASILNSSETAPQDVENTDLVADATESNGYFQTIASSVFGPIRLHGYLEIRPGDSLPPKEAVGYAAFIETIFYNRQAKERAQNVLGSECVTKARVVAEKQSPSKHKMRQLLDIALEHVSENNKPYLEAFIAHSEKVMTQ